MYLLPSTKTLVVSMGFTFGKSSGCPGGYDDSFTLSMIWRTLADALTPTRPVAATAAGGGGSATAMEPHQQLHPPLSASIKAGDNADRMTVRGGGGSSGGGAGSGRGGSCRCYCPPGQGFGHCVNVSNAKSCSFASVVGAPAQYCPSIGVTQQCRSPDDDATDVCNEWPELQQWQTQHEVANCTQTRRCSLVAGAKELATAACVCRPTKWAGCEYSTEPCPVDSPYFPVAR
jgi:hypothetical protein